MAPIEKILPTEIRYESEFDRRMRRERRANFQKSALAAILPAIPVLCLVLWPWQTFLLTILLVALYSFGWLYYQAYRGIRRSLDRD